VCTQERKHTLDASNVALRLQVREKLDAKEVGFVPGIDVGEVRREVVHELELPKRVVASIRPEVRIALLKGVENQVAKRPVRLFNLSDDLLARRFNLLRGSAPSNE
jgi:hypothetical protein